VALVIVALIVIETILYAELRREIRNNHAR
jgi:hypothetical protein